MKDGEIFKRALTTGAMRVRPLAVGGYYWAVPDMGLAGVCLNPSGNNAIDFSRCRRMSRGAACRSVRSMLDAPKPLKDYYLSLIMEGGAE